VVREPQLKSLAEIRAELKAASERPVAELPVGRHVFGKPNTFLNRLRLRAIHDLLQNAPGLYERFGGGGISVSSLMNLHRPGVDFRMTAYGATALTISSCHLSAERRLRMGVAFDHAALPGQTGAELAHRLAELLQEEFEALSR